MKYPAFVRMDPNRTIIITCNIDCSAVVAVLRAMELVAFWYLYTPV